MLNLVEKPTNGRNESWVTHEIIDRNNIGTQNRDSVYAWKKAGGTKKFLKTTLGQMREIF